jgi:hypothetical protein
MSSIEERLNELEKATRQTTDNYWRIQGYLNALELVVLSDLYNFAKTQPHPFQWVQDFVEGMRQSSGSLIPDVDNGGEGNRLLKETKFALDGFLEQVVRHAGQLPGAPRV